MMKRLLLLFAFGVSACEPEAPKPTAVTAPAPDAMQSGLEPSKKSASIVPRPEDQAQLDRMILAGFTPHAEHLHPPGIDECPMTKGSDVVM